MIGSIYGKLTIIKMRGASYCVCLCECGRVKEIAKSSIVSGRSRSCGCGQGKRMYSPTSMIEYRSYYSMIRRCYDSSSLNYKRYGTKGISVCDRWRFGNRLKTGFDCFLEDMGSRLSKNYQIDRFPNSKGNYEPSNCRWATRKENNRNKSTNRFATAFGETKTIVEWSEDPRCVVSQNTLLYRIKNTRYPPELLITVKATTHSTVFNDALERFEALVANPKKVLG